jgi:hypothetical protein
MVVNEERSAGLDRITRQQNIAEVNQQPNSGLLLAVPGSRREARKGSQ